ncbi:uncharacterized protein LOC141898304 [Tubulanus polymorphus]|uniref:uncharacterized protein LOC141898304 n=1 Tax=Tubulanus polymorphus TaxID=672921 RepID=UPI003DA52898
MASLVNYGNDESDENTVEESVENTPTKSTTLTEIDKMAGVDQKPKQHRQADYSETSNGTVVDALPEASVPVDSSSRTTEELQAEWNSFAELIGMAEPVPAPAVVDVKSAEPVNQVESANAAESDGPAKNSEIEVTPNKKEMEIKPDESTAERKEDDSSPKIPAKAKKKSTAGSSSSGSDDSSSDSSGSSSSSDSSDSESEDEKKPKSKKSKSKSPVKSPTTEEVAAEVEEPSKSVSRKEKSRPSHSRVRDERRKRSRSRGKRKRSRSRDRHRRRRSSRDRKSRRRRGGSRDRKRRSSRDRRRRRRSHSRNRRSRSRDRRRRGSPKRSRHRSRSASPRHRRVSERSPSPTNKKMTFKDQLRANFLKAQKDIEKGILPKLDEVEKKEVPVIPGEKPSNLPLYENPLLAATGGKPLTTDNAQATPQLAFLHTMAAMHQKAQELTGVSVPKYYNPAAVNPLKYAEQIQKRKLLWSKAKEKKEENKDQWSGTVFSQDQDGKVSAKFRKLMGIKGETSGGASVEHASTDSSKMSEEQKKKQQELFQRLDQDYEFARMTTHTHRGIGLGFTSQQIPQPPPGYK